MARNATIALLTAAALFVTSLPVPAQARLQSTDSVIASEMPSERARVDAFLAREDVAQQLRAMGVAPEEARARVATMSDSEISRIAGHIDDVPAGGNAVGVVIGAAVLIFIVLLITDIAGLTKVFPWTRSVR
jgi:hypothetical protein